MVVFIKVTGRMIYLKTKNGFLNIRISGEMIQTVIGGSDKYIPVCRICYEKDIEDLL
jgi:thymidine kinase